MALPILLGATALVVETARLLHLRHQLSVAADLGALAGVQNVDLDLLAAGIRYIPPDGARADAEEWTRRNLERLLPTGMADGVQVEVHVINASEEAPQPHPYTGRRLEDPTVSCVVTLSDVPLLFIPAAAPASLAVHADASIKTR